MIIMGNICHAFRFIINVDVLILVLVKQWTQAENRSRIIKISIERRQNNQSVFLAPAKSVSLDIGKQTKQISIWATNAKRKHYSSNVMNFLFAFKYLHNFRCESDSKREQDSSFSVDSINYSKSDLTFDEHQTMERNLISKVKQKRCENFGDFRVFKAINKHKYLCVARRKSSKTFDQHVRRMSLCWLT